MSNKKIHIVSFDIPWPANYGGVIDVFYKIKALFQLGYKIHLHCFFYNRIPSNYLETFCEKVTYYKRNTSKSGLFKSKPYIVVSRNDSQLVTNLNNDNFPILFEGLHTTYFLQQGLISKKRSIVRMHNIEHDYYRFLSKSEPILFKKYYFLSEANKLESYEEVLKNSSLIACISEKDELYFKEKYPSNKTILLPAFHPYEKVISKKGFGNYSLYHGNLSVSENHNAALFLVNEVFSKIDMPLIIAGQRANRELKKAIQGSKTITLIENPDNSKMEELQLNAQIHVLPTFQSTGLKLKLLSALFTGRHILVNSSMTDGTLIPDTLINYANSSEEFIKKINELKNRNFDHDLINKREKFLNEYYSNHKNALILEKEILSSIKSL